MQHLSINSYLQNGKYKIERVLGQGGFGITYLAYQPLLDRKVCIKEFFYKDYCERNEATSHVTLGTQSAQEMVQRFMNKFIKEAQTISRQKHPNIIDIYDIFTENNTAYYVMEYIEGESLSDMIKRNGALSEDAALNFIRQAANALSYIHAKSINHLDIKPANMMVRRSDNSLVLIDFGLSKQYDSTGGQTSSTPVGISEGYAPLEQYQAGGVSTFTPQTDIYSLGATLFYLVTGTVPPSASEVLNNGLPALPSHISASTKTAINQAMQFRKNDRLQSVKAFLNLLEEKQNTIVISPNFNCEETIAIRDFGVNSNDVVLNNNRLGKEKRSRKSWLIALIILAFVASTLLLLYYYFMYVFPNIDSKFKTFTVSGISFDMVKVEAGSFIMGKAEIDSFMLDSKAHSVILTKDYYIGKTEVTQDLWQAVMGNNPSKYKGDNKPVENVSWYDCQDFISKLNSLTGKHFCLPTEAEWEFAARGGKKSRGYIYSGSNNLDEVGWYGENSGTSAEYNQAYKDSSETHDVATKRANELGIYDMSGNVAEWCSDWYEPYTALALEDPKGPNKGEYRVCRGGVFYWPFQDVFANTYRGFVKPENSNYYGFRLALH